MLTHWWVGLGSRTSVIPEMSKARTWCRLQGPGIPELVLDLWWVELLSESWLQGLGCPEACVGLLASGVGAQWVPGLVLACWWLG